MKTKSAFIQQLQSSLEGLKQFPLDDLISENLLSPFSLEIPSAILQQAQNIVASLFHLREQTSYAAHYAATLQEKALKDPANKSIMMSYDFHVDPQQNLKLIEINTNAAFLILGHQMYASKGHPLPVPDFSLLEIGDSIRQEMQLQGKAAPNDMKVAIIDQAPSEQRLYIEFLAYNELFKSWGWDSRILDYRELFQGFTPDFIYNRYTDFFLNDASSAPLREKFLNRKVCLSPNPYEYFLLADKQRMIDWSEPGFLERHISNPQHVQNIRQCLPISHELCPAKAEQIWAQRKTLFFKPKNAFGSKQTYRGSSISRKAFDELLGQDIIAQEFVPAAEQTFETPEGPQNFKYDLRCYAYQGRVQLILARLYQGQVTNLRTPYGGFATVLLRP
ncbi:MAG: hypothetical protein AAGB31_08020 [Bdellovibrio sp.]